VPGKLNHVGITILDDTVVGCAQKTGQRVADGNPRCGVEKLREGHGRVLRWM
jgi:hypothetical protein